MSFEGSCLCGAVCYEIDSIDTPIAHCHCATCRKARASAFATTASVLREHFRWIAGEELLRAYESSPGKFRRFCSLCGSHVVAERIAKLDVILRVATLDADPGLKPCSTSGPLTMYRGVGAMPKCQLILHGSQVED
jgi:hypothetical protein